MANWTLSDIEQKVRNVTGRPDLSNLSAATLLDKINKYYQFVLPKELKIFFDYTYYNFFTTAGVDVYTPPATFATVNPQVYMDGFPGDWYTNPDLFFQDYPIEVNKVVVGTGDGTTNNFSFQIPYFPIIQGSLYVTDGTQVAQDNGSGGFTGNATGGSINYTTGAVTSLVFTNPPIANANITESSQTFISNRPQGILYFNNQFVLRPIPDQVYQIKMEGLPIPTALVNPTDTPFRIDLGPLIAYGASLDIFTDFDQMDQYEQFFPEYLRYKDIAMQDTYEVYLYQRSVPKF